MQVEAVVAQVEVQPAQVVQVAAVMVQTVRQMPLQQVLQILVLAGVVGQAQMEDLVRQAVQVSLSLN
jgi:hypothetical protein